MPIAPRAAPFSAKAMPASTPTFLETAVPEVPVEVVGLRVVRHREVRRPVVVEVERRGPESLAARVEEPRRFGDVRKPGRPVVSVEDGARPVVGLRGAVALVRPVERAEDVLLDGPLHIVQDEQVEVAVPVGVEPGRPARKAGMGHRGGRRRLAEGAAAGVFEEAVRPERRQIDIPVAVAVVIGDGCPDAVEGLVEPGTGGDVLEGSVAPGSGRAPRWARVPRGGPGQRRLFTKSRSWSPSPSRSKKATPLPMVSGRYFSPKAPFSWTNRIPAASVTLHEPRLLRRCGSGDQEPGDERPGANPAPPPPPAGAGAGHPDQESRRSATPARAARASRSGRAPGIRAGSSGICGNILAIRNRIVRGFRPRHLYGGSAVRPRPFPCSWIGRRSLLSSGWVRR